jgi:exosortase D (VPLPA-CTERM-specific)
VFGVYIVLIASLYYPTISLLIFRDWLREDYSYGYLIPFVVAYLIWGKKEILLVNSKQKVWIGFVFLVSGIFLYWLGELGGEAYAQYLSFSLVVLGIYLLHFGWDKMRAITFPFIMMLTMFPLPYVLHTKVSFGLKLISSQLGIFMLHLCGMSAYREGNVIDLGFTQLQVVDACSGLRYVIPLMVLTLVLTHWFKGHIWKKAFLFISSIPVAIFVNSFRIAITGILYGTFGAQVAEGFFHGFSGWLIFIFTIPILLVEMWVLNKLPPKNKRSEVSKTEIKGETGKQDNRESMEQDAVNGHLCVKSSTRDPFLQPVFVMVIILLGLTLVLSKTIEFREKVPTIKPFMEFPVKIGVWSGMREQMEQKFLDELDLTDYTIVNYKNRQGKSVNFYMAYNETQRKGKSTHSPETCLPASGWLFVEAGTTTVSGITNKPMVVKRAFMEKLGQKQLTYYWFSQRGRILTNIYQLKIYTFWDALTKHRTDGALVRLITPVYEKETLDDAEKRLQGFAKEIVPILNKYIPE